MWLLTVCFFLAVFLQFFSDDPLCHSMLSAVSCTQKSQSLERKSKVTKPGEEE